MGVILIFVGIINIFMAFMNVPYMDKKPANRYAAMAACFAAGACITWGIVKLMFLK